MSHVSIIVLNYKNFQDTIVCLNSIRALLYNNFNIIVVDNASENDSVKEILDWAEESFKESPLKTVVNEVEGYTVGTFQLLIAPENRGYAAGNNIGIKTALKNSKCEYFWILNNDTVVAMDSLQKLVECISNDQKIGICGSLLLNYEHKDTIQAAGGRYNKYIGTTRYIESGKKINDLNADKKIQADYPSGASILVKRAFIQSVGFMNEEYFLYFEEMDWVLRGKSKGWIACVCFTSFVWHKEGAAVNGKGGRTSKLSDYCMVRSRLLFTKMFYPHLLFLIYISLSLFFFNRLLRGQWDRIFVALRICFHPKIEITKILRYAGV